MYNAQDKAGRKVDYLHLSRETVARIFIGDISRWSDPAISADNKGLVLPDQPINVVYRGGQSGTTALFYDFIQHTIPDKFGAWATKNQLPTQVRIIQLDGTPHFAPNTQALNGSDQIAQFVASSGGLWSIAYDEFGYAGHLQRHHLRGCRTSPGNTSCRTPPTSPPPSSRPSSGSDLSQDLSGVYTSANPDAVPDLGLQLHGHAVRPNARNGRRATARTRTAAWPTPSSSGCATSPATGR